MEMLVVVAGHRNQYPSRIKSHRHARLGSSLSKTFREINCTTFQSGIGILPTPARAYSNPVTKHVSCLSPPSSPPSPSPTRRSPSPVSEPLSDVKTPKTSGSGSPVPIASNGSMTDKRLREEAFGGCRRFSYSELWAGPTYSNSPPPSSVPIPKFSFQTKRTVSLELPADDPAVEIQPMAKSAPASPTREHNPSARDLFLSADSATKTLRRILNLDVVDE